MIGVNAGERAEDIGINSRGDNADSPGEAGVALRQFLGLQRGVHNVPVHEGR